MAEDESTPTVLIAGVANLLIAVAKLAAGLASGSAAMLSHARRFFFTWAVPRMSVSDSTLSPASSRFAISHAARSPMPNTRRSAFASSSIERRTESLQ